MVAPTSRAPKTTAMMRQPKLFMPKADSPIAMSHLPSGGCTTKDAAGCSPERSPARIWALASLGHVPS